MSKLAVDIAGVKMKNPIMTASGTFGYGREFAELYDLSLLGGVVVKGTTAEPRVGNGTPRIAETPAGLLNSVGLQNPGIDKVIATELPFMRQFDTACIVNIAGHSLEDYITVAQKLASVEGVDALEVNISCPNVASGGMAFGTDPKVAAEVTKAVRSVFPKPIFIKLTPNVTDIVSIALAVEEAGADAISLINTMLGMAINPKTRRPIMANIVGGMSGPAVKPVALRMVWQVAKAVKVPVIGLGGISCATDVVEFFLAGASAVQVGSANFADPYVCPRIIAELNDWLDKEGVSDINELVGALRI